MSEMKIQPANLWSSVKAQCLRSGELRENPYINVTDEGKVMVTCPRCGATQEDKEYLVLSVMPMATIWSAPVRKCTAEVDGNRCGHLFSLIF